MKLSQLIEETKAKLVVEYKQPDQLIFLEDFPTIASFLEGNPMATEVVNKVMDLVWKGQHSEALAFLEKEHQDLKDPIMSLVYLQPHIAAKVAKD
jgi:hypothetical protein